MQNRRVDMCFKSAAGETRAREEEGEIRCRVEGNLSICVCVYIYIYTFKWGRLEKVYIKTRGIER